MNSFHWRRSSISLASFIILCWVHTCVFDWLRQHSRAPARGASRMRSIAEPTCAGNARGRKILCHACCAAWSQQRRNDLIGAARRLAFWHGGHPHPLAYGANEREAFLQIFGQAQYLWRRHLQRLALSGGVWPRLRGKQIAHTIGQQQRYPLRREQSPHQRQMSCDDAALKRAHGMQIAWMSVALVSEIGSIDQ